MQTLQRIQPPVYPVEKVTFPQVSTVTLANGIPVFLIESGTEELTRIEFTFNAGQIKEDFPLQASTVNMMLGEGSENYTSEKLHDTLDFYGSFMHLSIDKDRAGLVLFSLNRHFGKILELGREILYRPVFPEKEFTALMKKRIQWYRINREKVQNLASDQFFESIFGQNGSYGRQIREEDFTNLDREKLSGFHKSFYTPGNMAIILSGRIPADCVSLLDYHFGKIESSQPADEKSKPALTGGLRKKIHISRKGNLQTAIRIGSSTINKRNPDYPGLKILDTVLGGYFGSRLMKNIREDKGYTYGIRSSVASLDLSGYKVISTEVGSENTTKALDEIYKEISMLQNELVEEDELQVVRNYMAGEMLRMFDGPFSTAESFRSAWEFGLDLGYYNKFAEKIRSVTADEIRELANRYYKIDELYQVTAGSE